jgi:hypothetical protein
MSLHRLTPWLAFSLGTAGPSARAAGKPSPYEKAVHQTVSAYFVGQDAVQAEAEVETALGDAAGAAASPLAAVKAAAAKLSGDAAHGLAAFQTEAAVDYAVAQSAADAAISRSAVSRVDAALAGQTVPPAAAAALATLAARLDELLAVLNGN